MKPESPFLWVPPCCVFGTRLCTGDVGLTLDTEVPPTRLSITVYYDAFLPASKHLLAPNVFLKLMNSREVQNLHEAKAETKIWGGFLYFKKNVPLVYLKGAGHSVLICSGFNIHVPVSCLVWSENTEREPRQRYLHLGRSPVAEIISLFAPFYKSLHNLQNATDFCFLTKEAFFFFGILENFIRTNFRWITE